MRSLGGTSGEEKNKPKEETFKEGVGKSHHQNPLFTIATLKWKGRYIEQRPCSVLVSVDQK